MILYGFDLETRGDEVEYALQPFRLPRGEAVITAASLSVGNAVAGTLYPTTEQLRKMICKAISDDAYITGWNVAFDAAWCIAAGLEKEVFEAKWLDAMLLWKHLVVEPEGENVPKTKRKSYSLKAAMEEFYPDQAGFKEFEDFQATDKESMQKLLERNKGDVVWPVTLAQDFMAKLTEKQVRAALLEARCIPMVAWTKVQGINSDAESAQELATKLTAEAVQHYRELLEAAPEVEGINVGSPKQLQSLIYETWGLNPERFSKKTGLPSTDKYALFDLAVIDPRCAMLKKVRESKNNKTKYAKGTLDSLKYNGDGKVRPQARIFSTYTSRMTYASKDKGIEPTKNGTKKVERPVGVALHQWKRGKEYRRLIQVPKGYKLAEFDFAGQEFRWMAVASKDYTMLSLCQPGEDAHSYMGAQIARRDYRDLILKNKDGDLEAYNDRKAGKFCNLSYQYRISAKAATVKARIDYEMPVDEFFIQETQGIYKQSYEGVQTYWSSQIHKCSQLGYAETFAGRRVQLNGDWAGRTKWPMESTAINYPIQGTGGDQKYLAMAVARNYLPEFGGYFYFELHDGLFFIFPEDRVIQASDLMLNKLSNLPYKAAWGVDLPIKFPVDAKVGDTWGDLMDLEKYKEKR